MGCHDLSNGCAKPQNQLRDKSQPTVFKIFIGLSEILSERGIEWSIRKSDEIFYHLINIKSRTEQMLRSSPNSDFRLKFHHLIDFL